MKVLACVALWMVLGLFGCVACVDALLPAAEVVAGQEIAGREVPREEAPGPVENVSPGGSFSRVGGGYHEPYQGWAEVNAAAAEAEAAVRAAEAAKPDPPVTIVNVEVVQPPSRYRWSGSHRATGRYRVARK